MKSKEVTITKFDLISMQILLMFRATYNRRLLVVLFISSLIGGYKGLISLGVVYWVILAFVISTLGLICLTLVGSIVQALTATPGKGVIGNTKFTVSDKSFIEDTEGTATESSWKAIKNIYPSKNYTFVEVSGYRIHIIPKREFSSDLEFQDFSTLIQRFWNEAQQLSVANQNRV
ncbi:YcxB family protein [Reinekea blandensis]|uniref:YcxB-like C-terminal domain-containing protein n=1 Tax=Reinekea blandensis MED297 TaxID=314283 RepID=A4BFP6_9GAMM|nr:YcxB family protein [Reinekea blandensis]EAR09141.1 hypothetical protein MED297_17403 [Reinekea sp. MED297] [Reinekea blandensis MED297]